MNEEFVPDSSQIEFICKLRGAMIQACTDLESVMDLYLAEHFCESEQKIEEFACLILVPRVPWREKLEIMAVIIEQHNKRFWSEHKEFKKEIIKIIEHRNVFAHLPANLTEAGSNLYRDDKTIEFIRFKNTRVHVTKEIAYFNFPYYTQETIEQLINGIYFWSSEISNIIKSNRK